jgi:hypothetical protein
MFKKSPDIKHGFRHPGEPGRRGDATPSSMKIDLAVTGDYTRKCGPIEAEGLQTFGVPFAHGIAGLYHAEALNDMRVPDSLWGLAPGALFDGKEYGRPMLLPEFRKLVQERIRDPSHQEDELAAATTKRVLDFSEVFTSPSKRARLEASPSTLEVQPGVGSSSNNADEAKIAYKLKERAALREADAQQSYFDNRSKMIGFMERNVTSNSLSMLLQDQDYLAAKTNQDFVRVAYLIRSKSSNHGSCYATNAALEAKLYNLEFKFPDKGGNIHNYLSIWTANWNHLQVNRSEYPWSSYCRMMIQQLSPEYQRLHEDCVRYGFPRSLEEALTTIQHFHASFVIPMQQVSKSRPHGKSESEMAGSSPSVAMNVHDKGRFGRSGGRSGKGEKGDRGSTRNANTHQQESTSTQGSEKNPNKGGCHTWWNTGACKFGDKCRFSHDKVKNSTSA